MSHLRRFSIGLILRLAIATLISLLVWDLATFDRLPLPAAAADVIVRTLDFPVSAVRELLDPIRGFEIGFNEGSSWCDLCPSGAAFRKEMRIAIPTYLFLLYIPAASDGRALNLGCCN